MLLPLLQRIVTGDGAGGESTPSRMNTSGSSTSNSSPFFVPTPNSAAKPKLTTGYGTDTSEASHVDSHQKRCINPSQGTQSHHLPTVFSM